MSWVLFASNAVCKREYRDILYQETQLAAACKFLWAARTVSWLKGLCHPQAHVRVDEKHFEIVGPPFSNTVGEFRKLFSSV